MENPATWGRAEHIVAEALAEHHRLMQEHVCGLSDVRMITDALRKAGLLRDEKPGCTHPDMMTNRDGSFCPDCGACG